MISRGSPQTSRPQRGTWFSAVKKQRRTSKYCEAWPPRDNSTLDKDPSDFRNQTEVNELESMAACNKSSATRPLKQLKIFLQNRLPSVYVRFQPAGLVLRKSTYTRNIGDWNIFEFSFFRSRKHRRNQNRTQHQTEPGQMQLKVHQKKASTEVLCCFKYYHHILRRLARARPLLHLQRTSPAECSSILHSWSRGCTYANFHHAFQAPLLEATATAILYTAILSQRQIAGSWNLHREAFQKNSFSSTLQRSCFEKQFASHRYTPQLQTIHQVPLIRLHLNAPTQRHLASLASECHPQPQKPRTNDRPPLCCLQVGRLPHCACDHWQTA